MGGAEIIDLLVDRKASASKGALNLPPTEKEVHVFARVCLSVL